MVKNNKGSATMPMLTMVAFSYAFVTYMELSAVVMIPLILFASLLFVMGWKYGRGYEQNLGKPEEVEKVYE